jgi:hypothetical protein
MNKQDDAFTESYSISTIGVDFRFPDRQVEKTTKCRIWDTLDRNDSDHYVQLTTEAPMMELSWCLMSLRPSL